MTDHETVDFPTVLRHAARRARLARGIKPSQLARRMSALGYPWYPQTVSNVEQGRRRITAEELLGLAIALEAPISELVSPMRDSVRTEYVELPAGQRLLASMVRSMATPIPTRWVAWSEADEPRWPSQEFMEEWARLDESVAQARQELQRALEMRTQAQTREAQTSAVAEMRAAEERLSQLEEQFAELMTRRTMDGGEQ